jgi:hypothetical protein
MDTECMLAYSIGGHHCRRLHHSHYLRREFQCIDRISVDGLGRGGRLFRVTNDSIQTSPRPKLSTEIWSVHWNSRFCPPNICDGSIVAVSCTPKKLKYIVLITCLPQKIETVPSFSLLTLLKIDTVTLFSLPALLKNWNGDIVSRYLASQKIETITSFPLLVLPKKLKQLHCSRYKYKIEKVT